MLKKLLVGFTVILAIYAFLPFAAIDILSKIALGWMVMDLTDFFMKENWHDRL